MLGTLYLVATPIGNLADITLRALDVLKRVDLIACEDTRRTRKLLAHYNISKPTLSYHEHNERERAAEIVAKLEAGADIALVSDAGTPLVSDPGYRLVREAIERGVRVVSIPGPSALIAALAASGLATNDFTFAGFLPQRQSARRARLSALASLRSTLIFYETPRRIKEALKDARDILGDRSCVVARELTKVHEEFVRGTLSEVADRLAYSATKGELVLLIGSAFDDNSCSASSKPALHQTGSIIKEIEDAMRAEGIDRKNALKRVARLRGITKSEAYRLMLAEKAESERDT